MNIFITGGNGFIGSAVIKELLKAGHDVVGLARSDSAKNSLEFLGAKVFEGSLEDLESLKHGAEKADAVIHCAFIHDFANFEKACETDKQAIEAIGETLIGTGKPFLVTSGVPNSVNGNQATENEDIGDGKNSPRVSEKTALSFSNRGVKTIIVRPSRFVFSNELQNGFIYAIIGTALKNRFSAYVENGENRIHAVNVKDLAKLYLLALEDGKSGKKYHGVGDASIPFRKVAQAVGKRFNVPVKSVSFEEALSIFGFLGPIVSADNPASSVITQKTLGWKIENDGILEVLNSR